MVNSPICVDQSPQVCDTDHMFGHRSMRFGSPFQYTAAKYFQSIMLGFGGWHRDVPVRAPYVPPISKMEFMESKGLGEEYRASLRQQSQPTAFARHMHDPARPAAISSTGGLRGSTATRWR